MVLPNLIIAGAPRCGTSSLFRYLAAHPDVLPANKKETHYFVAPSSALFNQHSNFLHQGLPGYAAYFDHSGAASTPSIVLEATPGYMYQTLALRELPRIPTKPLFIFLLRNPARQVFSSYQYSRHQAANLPKDLTFEEFVRSSPRLKLSKNEYHRNAVEFAEYVRYLDRWERACGRDRLLILLHENMVEEPRLFMKELSSSLGLAPAFYDRFEFAVHNQNVEVRSRLLRRLGAGIGRRIGSGSLRLGLHRVYRCLNVAPREQPNERDLEVMRSLERHFDPFNRDLGERFGVDVSRWSGNG